MNNPTPKAVIAGGSGFLGSLLARHLESQGWRVVVLVRGNNAPVGRSVRWDGVSPGPWRRELDGAAAAINLAGRSINTRYTPQHRREILQSRLDSTVSFGHAVATAQPPPPVWLNASASAIYANGDAVAVDESNGLVPDHDDGDFLRNVCRQWEAAQGAISTPATRQVAMRIVPVLGHEPDTIYPVLRRLVKLHLGGAAGSGRQFVSWIHHTDFARAALWIIDHPAIAGPVNICAPNPVTNAELMRTFRRVEKVSLGLPASKWMIQIGTWLTRQEPELVLGSVRVLPGVLLKSGFIFEYPTLEAALRALRA